MSKFGRPKKEGKLSTFSQKSFYFPDSLKDIWREYIKISKRRISIRNIFPERCSQIQLKILVLKYVRHHTEDPDIKQKIDNYLQKEKERFSEMLKNWKVKSKEEKETIKNMSVEKSEVEVPSIFSDEEDSYKTKGLLDTGE